MLRVLLAACAACACAASACTSSGAAPTPSSHPVPTTRPSSSSAVTSSTVTSSSASSASSTAATSSTGSSTPHVAPPPQRPRSIARRQFDAMDEAQRVGQLLMVDCPSSGVAAATVTAIRGNHVGAVILDGNSTLGVQATRAITDQLQKDAPRRRKLFIATDQEGGLVQRMKGSGFSSIPSAVVQGQETPSTLQADATRWGRQLHRAGINVNLAPVLDTVPPGDTDNPPIGDLDREYGHTPGQVRSHGVAFARGMAAAHVDATAKHFPGLGRVTGNTDTTSGVTDGQTSRHDRYLKPFAAAVDAHVPFVMMSTAIYTRIDPNRPAAFSPKIVTKMLRGDLGFGGVVISDDVGAAAQVSGYSVGARAVRFIGAGGDMVLTVVASRAATMTAALLARAARSPSFKKKVDAAALRVLQAKQANGLLG